MKTMKGAALDKEKIRRNVRHYIAVLACAAFLGAAMPALAQGFFLPWNKKEEAAPQKPVQLKAPEEKKSLFGSVFLGKKEERPAQVAAPGKKISVQINDVIVELDPAMMGTKGPDPQSREELMALAVVRTAPMKEAAAKLEQETQKRLVKSKMEYQKRLKAAELAREQAKNRPQQVPASLTPSAGAKAAAPKVTTPLPTTQKPDTGKPSVFLGRKKQDDAAGDAPAAKPTGVFTDF